MCVPNFCPNLVLGFMGFARCDPNVKNIRVKLIPLVTGVFFSALKKNIDFTLRNVC